MPIQRRGGIEMWAGAAVPVTASPGCIVASADLLVEAVHFLVGAEPAALGAKSVAVNLSDIAAMGARPLSLLVHVQAPADAGAWLEAFRAGAQGLADGYATSVHFSHEPAATRRISVQVLGCVETGEPLTRRGARPGHRVVVTGTLGDAGGALELLIHGRFDATCAPHQQLRARLDRPTPRLAAGARARGIASAGLDLSDGLAGDLPHLLDGERLGARIDVAALPLSAALVTVLGVDRARHHALGAGDDYELCLTVAPARLATLLSDLRSTGCQATAVGEIVAEPGLALHLAGRPYRGLATPATGYRHFTSQADQDPGAP